MNYLIDFVPGTDQSNIDEYLSSNVCTVLREFSNFSHVYLVSCDATPTSSDLVTSIIDDDASPIQLLTQEVPINRYYWLPVPGQPVAEFSTSDQKDWWKNFVIRTPDFDAPANEVTRKGANSTVYIMDSGIDSVHPEFDEATVQHLYSFTNEYSDTNGHGTAIASVISGKTCGLSNAKLNVVKIFDDVVETKQSDILGALDAILVDYLTNSPGVGIVNCSWSIPRNQYIEDKFTSLIDAGMFIIVSAGNSGTTIGNVTPAAMPAVLTIGSFNADLVPSNFSNYSNPSAISFTAEPVNTGALDGWAPGEQIWAAVPGGTYGFVAGTSIAAAIQSCALAYNFGDRVDSEGNTFSMIVTRDQADYLSQLSLRRKDILDLSNPKYADSVNRITTLVNKVDMSRFRLRPFLELPVRVGDAVMVQVLNPQNTASAVLVSALPDGFSIRTDGMLVGTVPAIDSDYQIIDSVLRITLLDDTQVDKEIRTVILGPNFDKANYPADDPVQDITLERAYCGSGGPAGQCDTNCDNPDWEICEDPLPGKPTKCGCVEWG